MHRLRISKPFTQTTRLRPFRNTASLLVPEKTIFGRQVRGVTPQTVTTGYQGHGYWPLMWERFGLRRIGNSMSVDTAGIEATGAHISAFMAASITDSAMWDAGITAVTGTATTSLITA